MRLPKDELVERTLAAEQAFAQERVHRLRTADELVTWMLITAQVIAWAIAVEGLDGNMLTGLGSVALLQGDLDRAEACLREGGLLCAQVESAHLLAARVLHLGAVALGRGDARRGARLLGAAEGLWGAVDSGILPVYWGIYGRVCSDLRQRLSKRAFASIRAEGRQMSLQEVTGYAFSARQVIAAEVDPLQVLTPREREVVRLTAQGLTNREIAGVLVLAEGTAVCTSSTSWPNWSFIPGRNSPPGRRNAES